MVLVWKQHLSNWKLKHIEETALLMAIFFLFKNGMKNLFFSDARMHKSKKLLSLEKFTRWKLFSKEFQNLYV